MTRRDAADVLAHPAASAGPEPVGPAETDRVHRRGADVGAAHADRVDPATGAADAAEGEGVDRSQDPGAAGADRRESGGDDHLDPADAVADATGADGVDRHEGAVAPEADPADTRIAGPAGRDAVARAGTAQAEVDHGPGGGASPDGGTGDPPGGDPPGEDDPPRGDDPPRVDHPGRGDDPPRGDDAPGEDDPPGGDQPRGTAAFLYAVLLLIPIGFFLAPLVTFILWRMRRGEPLLDFHGRQAMDLVLGMLLGATVHLVGRYTPGWPGIALQWAGLAAIALQGVLVVWGAFDAGRGRLRYLPLSLPILRRPERRGRESADDE